MWLLDTFCIENIFAFMVMDIYVFCGYWLYNSALYRMLYFKNWSITFYIQSIAFQTKRSNPKTNQLGTKTNRFVFKQNVRDIKIDWSPLKIDRSLFHPKTKIVFVQQKPIDPFSKQIDPFTFIANYNVRILQKSTGSFTFNAPQRL